ncbi:COQ9 family protein [Flavisphingomonas formosensis]|uniref:COQ9 family protein n=1 Tax=Flavisphingomonas formosensis TaxID=861534 RepID=UPI0012F97F44|nr:COQ9 family protein [Sphingomonas formosensis]
MTMPDEMTLDELRAALAPRIPAHAAFDGWSDAALASAAAEIGVPADRAKLAFPDGPIGMIDAWIGLVDAEMVQRLPSDRLASMKIRERIRAMVLARLAIAAPNKEALRRALALLALPGNLATAARIGWRSADAMWRLAGDQSTDFAWYSKRSTLAAIYAATLLAWIDDESEGDADTHAFLDRRIDGVMRFESLKAKLRPDRDRHFSPARLLGRLRYPVR